MSEREIINAVATAVISGKEQATVNGFKSDFKLLECIISRNTFHDSIQKRTNGFISSVFTVQMRHWRYSDKAEFIISWGDKVFSGYGI